MGFKKSLSANSKRAKSNDDYMFPIMSLMIILIPFLVGNIAFMQFKVINATTPGQNNSSDEDPKKTKNVISQLFVSNAELKIQLVDEDSGDVLKVFKYQNNKAGAKSLNVKLNEFKEFNDKFDTLLVSVEKGLKYSTVMEALEFCKFTEPEPQQVQAGVKPKKLNVVILPQGVAS